MQHLELVEGLHAEVADTEAALAQLQQERMSHADLLATYTDQVHHCDCSLAAGSIHAGSVHVMCMHAWSTTPTTI